MKKLTLIFSFMFLSLLNLKAMEERGRSSNNIDENKARLQLANSYLKQELYCIEQTIDNCSNEWLLKCHLNEYMKTLVKINDIDLSDKEKNKIITIKDWNNLECLKGKLRDRVNNIQPDQIEKEAIQKKNWSIWKAFGGIASIGLGCYLLKTDNKVLGAISFPYGTKNLISYGLGAGFGYFGFKSICNGYQDRCLGNAELIRAANGRKNKESMLNGLNDFFHKQQNP